MDIIERCRSYILIIAEKSVHVFEGPICGFGVEEVYDGNEGGVEYRPDAVVAGQYYARTILSGVAREPLDNVSGL